MAGAAGLLCQGQPSGRAGRDGRRPLAAGSLVLRSGGLPLAAPRPHISAMPFPAMPDPALELELEQARRHPERETLELATAGAVQVLGARTTA